MIDRKKEFMDAIRQNPNSEAERLIFADWCEENGEHELAAKLRDGQTPFMLRRTGRDSATQDHDKYRSADEEFRAAVIAQDDDNDYSESGFVAVRIDDWCAIARYGHCSCYDTWSAITGGGTSDHEGPNEPRWDWQGTYAQLLDMAARKADPSMPDRECSPEDCDYDHLMKVYDQILTKGKAP